MGGTEGRDEEVHPQFHRPMIREGLRRDAISESRRPATRVSFHLPSTTSHDIKSHEPPRGTRRYAYCRKKLRAYAIVTHFSIM